MVVMLWLVTRSKPQLMMTPGSLRNTPRRCEHLCCLAYSLERRLAHGALDALKTRCQPVHVPPG